MVNSLPVVVREMRVIARKGWIYWLRFGVVLASIVGWLLILAFSRDPLHEKGILLLVVVSAVAMVLTMIAGVFLTADCISDEKREGTLGLLFLTDLKGYDIVLGKLAANSAAALFALVGLLPVLSLPILTGGVTWAETVRIMLILVISLALSLAIGMYVSSRVTESRSAFATTLLMVLMIWGLPMAFRFMAEAIFKWRRVGGIFFSLSPVQALSHSFERSYAFGSEVYWVSVIVTVMIAVLLVFLASRRVANVWREQEIVQKLAAPKQASPSATELRRFKRLEITRGSDLYEWLSYRGSKIGRGTRLFFIVLTITYFVMLVGSSMEWKEPAFIVAFCAAFLGHAIVKLLFALEASRQVQQDTRSGAMELLLATPLLERQIVSGQGRACRRRFRRLKLLLAGMNAGLLFVTFACYDHLHMGGGAGAVFTIFFVGGVVALMFDMWALESIGICKALEGKTHLRTTFDTVKVVLGIPWLLFPAFFSTAASMRGGERALVPVMIVWFSISIFIDAMLTVKARIRLRHCFRTIVSGGGVELPKVLPPSLQVPERLVIAPGETRSIKTSLN